MVRGKRRLAPASRCVAGTNGWGQNPARSMRARKRGCWPANQIIHVEADEAFPAQGLFPPVWVTGKLRTERSKQSVGLSDGTSTFDVGYVLKASSVQIYG